MNISHIHKALLLNVMKVADIFEIKIHNTKTDRPVEMLTFNGDKYLITKQELVDNFTDLQGKKLSMLSLKNNKSYLVAKLQSTPCFAVKVPKKSDKQIQTADGTMLGPGKVIVIHANKVIIDGDYADVSQGTVISEALFRKTCVLKEVSDEFRERLITSGVITDNDTMQTAGPITSAPIVPPVSQNNTFGEQPQRPLSSINLEETQLEKSSAAVAQSVTVLKIIYYIGTTDVAGYLVNMNGQEYTITPEQLYNCCNDHIVTNVTTVTNHETGKQHLRGVGIKLEDLPIDYV